MSTCRGGVSKGPPKHQNKTVWKPNAGIKKNETEVGSKQRPYPAITGVCPRCKQQIEWRRKYGKYKPLTEAAKCNDCGKRTVKQAHHTICIPCSKKRNVCAKCCRPAETIVGSNVDAEEERKQLENALKNMRERDRRTLLRTMPGGSSIMKTPANKKQGNEVSDADDDVNSDLEVGSDEEDDENDQDEP